MELETKERHGETKDRGRQEKRKTWRDGQIKEEAERRKEEDEWTLEETKEREDKMDTETMGEADKEKEKTWTLGDQGTKEEADTGETKEKMDMERPRREADKEKGRRCMDTGETKEEKRWTLERPKAWTLERPRRHGEGEDQGPTGGQGEAEDTRTLRGRQGDRYGDWREDMDTGETKERQERRHGDTGETKEETKRRQRRTLERPREAGHRHGQRWTRKRRPRKTWTLKRDKEGEAQDKEKGRHGHERPRRQTKNGRELDTGDQAERWTETKRQTKEEADRHREEMKTLERPREADGREGEDGHWRDMDKRQTQRRDQGRDRWKIRREADMDMGEIKEKMDRRGGEDMDIGETKEEADKEEKMYGHGETKRMEDKEMERQGRWRDKEWMDNGERKDMDMDGRWTLETKEGADKEKEKMDGETKEEADKEKDGHGDWRMEDTGEEGEADKEKGRRWMDTERSRKGRGRVEDMDIGETKEEADKEKGKTYGHWRDQGEADEKRREEADKEKGRRCMDIGEIKEEIKEEADKEKGRRCMDTGGSGRDKRSYGLEIKEADKDGGDEIEDGHWRDQRKR
ncbi:golgin subfamily A member 6-like protein 22 [Haliotis rubra]|uniref:golgin subfamily A member 6-like protein 22 n=1 Tax=Haliotis rubra TaxID=36100 RepID=UPI001EE4F94E|nr:golgin subfamily A member 6-like protein 22 [Haliotis rubra]